MKEERSPYSASDLERYHRGQMSASEKHALEKAALDDPFLADALEGYQYAANPAVELEAIRARLEKRKGKNRGGTLVMAPWMRIAALFLLLAGAGWLVYRMQFNKESDLATRALPDPEIKIQPQAKPTEPETTDDSQSYNYTIESKEAPVTGTASSKKKLSTGAIPERNNPPMMQQEALVATEQTSKEQLEEVRIRPAAAPPIAADEAMAKARVNGDSITNLDVVMQPLPDSLTRTNVVKLRARASKEVKAIEKFEELEPLNGWTSYNDYIASNLVQPRDNLDKPVKGEVELSFDIDGAGKPVNITVVRSLCALCDKEAIRLLKTGPAWKSGDKKGKIVIAF